VYLFSGSWGACLDGLFARLRLPVRDGELATVAEHPAQAGTGSEQQFPRARWHGLGGMRAGRKLIAGLAACFRRCRAGPHGSRWLA
jgi:hypothetical protein